MTRDQALAMIPKREIPKREICVIPKATSSGRTNANTNTNKIHARASMKESNGDKENAMARVSVKHKKEIKKMIPLQTNDLNSASKSKRSVLKIQTREKKIIDLTQSITPLHRTNVNTNTNKIRGRAAMNKSNDDKENAMARVSVKHKKEIKKMIPVQTIDLNSASKSKRSVLKIQKCKKKIIDLTRSISPIKTGDRLGYTSLVAAIGRGFVSTKRNKR